MSLPSPPLQYSDIERAICATLSALSRHGLEGCLIGSAASYFHGMRSRVPNDIDVVVVNPSPAQTSEEIKILITQSDERFSLVPSRAPGATHQVMWIALPAPIEDRNRRSNVPLTKTRSKASRSRGEREGALSRAPSSPTRLCKVDILIPSAYMGVEYLDSTSLIPDHYLAFTSYWDPTTRSAQTQSTMQPVNYIPLLTLVLLKLSVWSDYSVPDAHEKFLGSIPKHEQDIEQLLRTVIEESRDLVALSDSQPIDRPDWRLGGFANVHEIRKCIGKYVKKWPNTTTGWFTVLKLLQ